MQLVHTMCVLGVILEMDIFGLSQMYLSDSSWVPEPQPLHARPTPLSTMPTLSYFQYILQQILAIFLPIQFYMFIKVRKTVLTSRGVCFTWCAHSTCFHFSLSQRVIVILFILCQESGCLQGQSSHCQQDAVHHCNMGEHPLKDAEETGALLWPANCGCLCQQGTVAVTCEMVTQAHGGPYLKSQPNK